MVNLVRATGGLLIVSGHTYKVAEEASTIGSALPAGADKGALAASSPYKLPGVTEGFPESDPPPSGLMQMLFFVESLVGGCQWPDGNLDGLVTVAQAWRAAAYSIRLVAEEVRGHARVVTANNAGEATRSFATFADALQGGGDAGGLLWLASACEGMAGSVENLLRQKNAARLQFRLSLEFLVATWALAMAISAITGGGSIAAATATTQAEGFALKAFLRQVLKAVVAGAWFSGGLDAAGQYSRIHYGLQKGFDGGEFVKAVGEGAVAGGVMGVGGAWIGMGRNRLTEALSGWMSTPGLKGAGARFLVAGSTGTAGNVAAQAAFDKGHVDWTQAAAFGFGMAGIEGFKDVGRHAAAQFTNPHPGDGSAPPHAPPDDPSGGNTGGDGRALPSVHPTVSEDGIPNPRIYPHYSDRGVGYDLTAGPGDHHWNDPATHPTAQTSPTHTPTTDLATDHATPPAASNIPHYDITSFGRENPAGGTDHGGPAGPLPAVPMGMDNGALPGGSRPNVPAVPGTGTPAPAHGAVPVAGPPRPPAGEPASAPHGRPAELPPGGTPESTPLPATTPARTETGARLTDTAHRALVEARQIVAPDGLLLQDGGVRVTDRSGRTVLIPEDVLHGVEDRLASRAADGATVERLRAEAAAWMGAEIARSGHQPAVDGALEALKRLSDHSPDNAVTAAAVAREVRMGDRHADPARRLLDEDGQTPPDPTLRPHLRDATAREILERAKNLAADPSHPAHGQESAHAQRHGAGHPDASGAAATVVRPPHMDHLSMDEVRSALARLRPSDFGRGVTGWHWSADGTTLHVETESWGTLDFTPVIGELPETLSEFHLGRGGAPHELEIARWAMSKEAAEAAGLPPAAVAEAGEVLPQVLRHAITDGVQRSVAEHARSGQGVVRRLAENVRAAVRNDGQVERLINDHRAAASAWREATDPVERTRIAEQIRQLGQDLQTAGQTPPEPPWVEGADGFMPGHAPPTPLSELTGQARHMADALHQDTHALAAQIAAHQIKAHDARTAADKALDDAITAADQKDRGAPERARQAFGRAEAQEADAQRHEGLADNYQKALNKAVTARTAYRALESNLDQMAAEPHSTAMTKVYADASVLLARRGEEAYTAYEQALDAVLPPDFVKPDAILTDRLPLRNRLTDTANELVAGEKIPDELFPADFERRLLAQTGDLLSKDGARVAVGTDGAEIVVTMEIKHLVESPYPDGHPGEQAVGAFHEGGQTNSAAANHSSSTGYELDSGKLAQLVPGDHPVVSTFREVMKVFGPSLELDRAQGWSETASHLNHAQKGAVGNIRGGNVTVVEGVPEFHVRLVRADGSETVPVHVTTGAYGDATTAKALVSNSHTLEPPEKLAQLPFGERQQVPLPHHLATPMEGVEDHFKKVAAAVEAEHGPLSPADRESLRELIKAEAKNHSGGLRFAMGADVFLRTTLRLDVNRAVPMAASKIDFMEEVNVGLIGTSGTEVYNVSTGGSAGIPINPFTKAVDVVPGHHEFNVGFDVKASGSRTVTHTETVNVGGTTIPVTVVRHVGRTVMYVFPRGSMVLETHVYSARTNRAIGPITQEVSGFLRFEESDAYRYGLPVDHAALVRGPDGEVARHPDGSAVLRDDPRPGAPEGRKPMLPSHIGDGPGQLRGFGDAAVEFSGIEESAKPVMAKLRELGVLPELDAEGLPHPAERPNLAEIVAQGQAQRKMEELTDRVHANADQAAQLSGIKTRLPRVTQHGRPMEYELETYVEQDFHDWRPVGMSDSKQLIKLDIDSQSNGQTETRAVARTGGGGASVGHKPAASGAEEKVGGDAGRNGGSSTSKAASFMNNVLGIRENGSEMSVGEQSVTYRHRLRDPDGNVVEEWRSKGHVTVGTPLDWLPYEDAPSGPPAHAGPAGEATPTSPKVAAEAQWHQFDAGDLIDRVHATLREKGVRPPGGIATFLDGKSLSTNSARWLGNGYETSVTIDPHGMQPTRYKIRVTGTLEPSTYYTDVNQVSGDIGLSAVGLTSTEGRSGGYSVTGSGSGSAHHGDRLTDGGSGDIKKAAGASSSHSESNTSGVERLKIGTDPDVSYRTVVHLDVQITDAVSGWSEHVLADAKGVYSLSESDALKLQAEGELTLPPEHMADVMQRFLDGTLMSDPQVVARQVDRYLGQLAEARHAGDPLPALSAGHTAQVLADKVESLTDVGKSLTQGTPEQRLGQTLPGAQSLSATGPQVRVAAMFEHSMATSLFERYQFHGRDGREMSVHDAALEALRQRSPRALETDPSLGQRLSGRFEGRGWEGLVDEMFDPQGSGRDYDVRVDETGRMEKLDVHAQLRITGPPTLEGVTKHVVSLHQAYGWEGQSRTTGSNRSLGGDVGAADGSSEGGSNGSVATGQSRSMSGTTSHTHVELNRLRWFDADGIPPEKVGMATIRHPVTITITVDQHPVGPGQKGAKAQPDVPGPVTVEIQGYIERLIPARMVEPVAADPAAVPAVERTVDPRPVELDGNRYYVQWVEAAQAHDVMRETFVDLLGKGSERTVDQELSRQWSALVRQSPTNFQRMVGEEGYEIKIQHGNRAASTRIHLDARDLRIDDIGGAETSRVNRDDSTTATSVTVGHLLPASGTVEVKDGVTGIGVKRSAGAQASQTISDSNGHRIETNEFNESVHAGTGSAKVTFHLDFSRGRRHVHHTADGEVHLTLAESELGGIRAKQEAGDPRDQAWELDARNESGGHDWDVVQAEEGRTAAPLTQAIMQAQLGNHDVFLEVRESDGRSHHYRASPKGRLYNEDRLPNGERWSDGGFAPQFADMPRPLGRLADENRIDLRRLFEQSPVPGTLSDKVRAELAERGVTLPPDAMPVQHSRPTGPDRHGSALGSVPGTGSAPSGGFGGGGGT